MNRNSEILRKFGKRVQELRLQKGITSQIALANKAKMDRTYIGGIERGERNLSLENIEKIAKALNIKLEELFKF
jgi:transcriptional regulator with XRE-family HTH domain